VDFHCHRPATAAATAAATACTRTAAACTIAAAYNIAAACTDAVACTIAAAGYPPLTSPLPPASSPPPASAKVQDVEGPVATALPSQGRYGRLVALRYGSRMTRARRAPASTSTRRTAG
jgi:hypothetical protein